MKKTLILGALFLIIGGLAAPHAAKALTREEILAQIEILLQQVRYLQDQINRLQGGGGGGSCNYFYRDLQYRDYGSEVSTLHDILTREGFAISQSERSSQQFGLGTVTAVARFQEKYSTEILYNSGFSQGTGYVGPNTRAKLNQLYCGSSGNPSGAFRVITPNGGETWNPGTMQIIQWSNPNFSYVTIELVRDSNYGSYESVRQISSGISGTSFNWMVPNDIQAGQYRIRITGSYSNNYTSNASDVSDSAFYIGGSNYSGTLRVTSPNGGENYSVGQNMRVQWNFGSLSYGNVNVELWKGSQYIQSTGVNGASFADIYLATSLVPGTDYKVRVAEANNSSNFDWSDQNFTIMSDGNYGNRSITLQATPTSGYQPLSVTFSATLYNFPSCGSTFSWQFGDGGVQSVAESCSGSTTIIPARTISVSHTFQYRGNYSTTVTASGITSNSITTFVY